MPTLTRAEREARIARDDGDSDDEVHTSTNWKASAKNAYHEAADCRHLQSVAPENRIECTRGEAQRRGRFPCSECVLDEGPEGRPVGCTGGKAELEVLIERGQVPDQHLGAGWSDD